MKAVFCRRYGSPDFLTCEEVEKPSPGAGEVLIRVRAAALNPLDWHMKRGNLLMRVLNGLFKPADPRLGVDVAGVVESVGSGATLFKPGDEVFGSCRGAFAEYACTPESALVLKPAGATFEDAAALPIAAYTALQGLRDAGKLRPGQAVLINGAAGGVGALAVQVARWLGAEVTGVCSTGNADLVRSIGAERVIDYTRDDFTAGDRQYDLIFDLVANHPLSAIRRVMKPGGIYMGVGILAVGTGFGMVFRLLNLSILSRLAGRRMIFFAAKRSRGDLAVAADLLQTGVVRPVIGGRFGLGEVAGAIRLLETGHARGKLVVTV